MLCLCLTVSLQNISQFLLIILVVFLAVFPRRELLIVVLHERVPGVVEIQRLHHAELAAGGRQRLQPRLDLRLLPLEETSGEDGQTHVFARLEDFGQFPGAGGAGAGRHVPGDAVFTGGVAVGQDLLEERLLRVRTRVLVLHVTSEETVHPGTLIHQITQEGFISAG